MEVLEYTELAKYYDLYYSHMKDYRAEAYEVRRLVGKYKEAKGNELLDAACGTGRHLAYLKRWYSCTGVDISRQMLDIAKGLVKGVRFERADITRLNMRRKFDAITCLFSAIGYVRTYANLERTVKNFRDALNPGGVLIIDGWFDRKGWRSGAVHMQRLDLGKVKMAKVSYSARSGMTSEFEDHWLIGEEGKGVRHVVDRQRMGLFEQGRFMRILERNGFEARVVKSPMAGRPRYVAVRRQEPS